MPKNRHYRNGVQRKRWTCPLHKDGPRKTVVGKPCPTCGATSGSIAIQRLAQSLDWSLSDLPSFEVDDNHPERVLA